MFIRSRVWSRNEWFLQLFHLPWRRDRHLWGDPSTSPGGLEQDPLGSSGGLGPHNPTISEGGSCYGPCFTATASVITSGFPAMSGACARGVYVFRARIARILCFLYAFVHVWRRRDFVVEICGDILYGPFQFLSFMYGKTTIG